MLPVTCMSDLEDDIREDCERFAQALPGASDSIAVIDASGNCLWTSDELQLDDSCPVRGAAWLKSDLERALARVFGTLSQDDLMDEG